MSLLDATERACNKYMHRAVKIDSLFIARFEINDK